MSCKPSRLGASSSSGKVLSKLGEPVRYSPELDGSLSDLVNSVKTQGLEGLVAKRRDSLYEPGQRSGSWQKMRVNQGQEFVIGGYTPSPKNFDALIFGYYESDRLLYVARTRNGFTPRSREELFKRLHKLRVPSARLQICQKQRADAGDKGSRPRRWPKCRWVKPVLVGQFEFVEWTPDNHLRHSRFIGLREDKFAKDIGREL